jgi:hypothetical protein
MGCEGESACWLLQLFSRVGSLKQDADYQRRRNILVGVKLISHKIESSEFESETSACDKLVRKYAQDRSIRERAEQTRHRLLVLYSSMMIVGV